MVQVAWETRAQAFQGVLEECVQEAKSTDLQAAALRFLADQIATLTESGANALDTPIRQALTHLMQSAIDKLQVSSKSPMLDHAHICDLTADWHVAVVYCTRSASCPGCLA